MYCLNIDNLKTAEINPVSTEWIGFVWSIKYVVTITKEFTYNWSDQLDDNVEGGNTVPHENVSTRKIGLQKKLEIT